MDNCFRAIQHNCSLTPQLLETVLLAGPENWTPYYNFRAFLLGEDFVYQDKFLKDLAYKRQYIAGLLELPPNTAYNWHVDTDRHCGLNMLVYDDGQSKCLFAPEGEVQVVMPIVELKYQPNTFYAFNTKVPHTVINFTEKRYMFSLEFVGEDYRLPYDTLLADIKELGYGY
jgi:hypothetical protein